MFRCIAHCLAGVLLALACLTGTAAAAPLSPQPCGPAIERIQAAPSEATRRTPPDSGWVPVTLPDVWSGRWPEHTGAVWYRIDWRLPCPDPHKPIAFGLQSMNITGEVYSNDDLLWRGASLTEPLSRSSTVPRQWLIPASSLKPQDNTLWVRVLGHAKYQPGLGAVKLDWHSNVDAWHETRRWLQRDLPLINMSITAVLGCIFLLFWLLRRQESAAGWYAVMSAAWILFIGIMQATTSWPFASGYSLARTHTLAFSLYSCAFSMFIWRFAELRHPRYERTMWSLLIIGAIALLSASDARVASVGLVIVSLFTLLFIANCLWFQGVAWRTRDASLRLMALCLLTFPVLGVIDLLGFLAIIQQPFPLIPLSTLITTLMMSLILAWRFNQHQVRMEQFNQELSAAMDRTRTELRRTLKREHALALRNTRLSERLRIAHDLHDGMGSTLVRTIAQVEHAAPPLDNRHVLSALKSMRDDLRQIIDSGTSAGATATDTPQQWLAPLRHRFVRLLEDLDVTSSWQVPAQWPVLPTAAQCLALTRIVEEAMTNVIKHAKARHVRLSLEATPDGAGMLLRMEDDGVGFDLQAVLDAGLSVGIHSMRQRIAKAGGVLSMTSEPGRTLLCVTLGASARPDRPPDNPAQADVKRTQ